MNVHFEDYYNFRSTWLRLLNNSVKGERLFGWNTLNLMNFVQESYVFHLINIKNHVGFFYDISPIDSKLFWKRWDLRRMGAINEFTDKLWRDHRIERIGFTTTYFQLVLMKTPFLENLFSNPKKTR